MPEGYQNAVHHPQNHPARVVSAIIDKLDINEIESGYAGVGTSSYNLRMLLTVIVYAYLNNVYSGHQMEKLLVENIAYMWLNGIQTPDFRTIANNFRKYIALERMRCGAPLIKKEADKNDVTRTPKVRQKTFGVLLCQN